MSIDKLKTGVKKIKFPVLNNVEFFDVIKDRKTIKTYKGKDLENKTWRYLQELVGKDCGAGSYHFTMKFINDSDQHNGQLRAVGSMPHLEETNTNSLQQEINSLKSKLENASQGNGISFDLLISVTKQSYETQISFLNQQIQQKENLISKLESKIESLENELNQADDIIEDLKAKTGINQYLEIAQTFLKSKLGNTKPIQSLKDSNPDDIPKQIIDLLGTVQWNEVEQNVIDQIVFYLNAFIPKLPLKGQS